MKRIVKKITDENGKVIGEIVPKENLRKLWVGDVIYIFRSILNYNPIMTYPTEDQAIAALRRYHENQLRRLVDNYKSLASKIIEFRPLPPVPPLRKPIPPTNSVTREGSRFKG